MFSKIAFALLIVFIAINYSQAQNDDDSYQFIQSIMPDMQRKVAANEIMASDDEKYLIVNYGNRPTFIIIYSFEDWKQVATFRTTDWVDFSGAYVDSLTNQIYIKESRYSSNYHRLDIKSGKQDIIPCDLTPDGCPVVDQKKSVKSLFSKNKKYFVTISKQNDREVKIYRYTPASN